VTLLIAVHFGIACLAPLLTRWLHGRAFFALALAPAVAFGWLVALAPTVLRVVCWSPSQGRCSAWSPPTT
jgi:multicomponent Na+:H+ antiporter subunit A